MLQGVLKDVGNREDEVENAQKEIDVLRTKLRRDSTNKEISASERESGMNSNEVHLCHDSKGMKQNE